MAFDGLKVAAYDGACVSAAGDNALCVARRAKSIVGCDLVRARPCLPGSRWLPQSWPLEICSLRSQRAAALPPLQECDPLGSERRRAVSPC